MDAKPVLIEVARALREHDLEAILIGNAAAALRGAPVTTIDLDFLVRKTPANLRKLERVANAMKAVLTEPHYPVSGLYRVAREEDSLQVDFMSTIHGVRSFNRLRSRASEVDFDGLKIMVASLADIIASKKAANRPQDRAVIDVLEETLSAGESPRSTEGRERP